MGVCARRHVHVCVSKFFSAAMWKPPAETCRKPPLAAGCVAGRRRCSREEEKKKKRRSQIEESLPFAGISAALSVILGHWDPGGRERAE